MVGELQRLCTWELFTVAQLGRRAFACSFIHFCTVEFLTTSITLYEGLKMLLFRKMKEAGSSFYQVAGLACAWEMGQNEAYNLQICNCLHRPRGKSTSSC